MSRPIRIVVADDHAILRMSLITALQTEPDFQVIGEAADGREAVDVVQKLRPDVAVMDVTMPRLNGIEATRMIAATCPDVKIVGLSMHERDTMAATMLAAGARTYVVKSAPLDELFEAVRLAVA